MMASVRMMGSVRRAVAKTSTIVSTEAMSSLFFNSGGNKTHRHPPPRTFGIMPAILPAAAALLSFEITSTPSIECAPREPSEELCTRAANMLYNARDPSFTARIAMKAAGYSDEDCGLRRHQMRVQRLLEKLEEDDGNPTLKRAANMLYNATDPSFNLDSKRMKRYGKRLASDPSIENVYKTIK